MEEPGMSFLWRQLAYQIPGLIVYLVGVILALVWFGRARGPAALCLLGCGLLILTALAVSGIQAYFFQQRFEAGLPDQRMAQAMNVVAVAGNIVRAVGIGLVIAAVFVGRRVERRHPPNDVDAPTSRH